MQDEQVATVLSENLPRMVGDGVHYPIIQELAERIDRWDQWFDAWEQVALSYEQRAVRAEASGLSVSAGEDFWQAAICWQYAQFLWFHEPERRLHGQQRKVEAYRRAALLLSPPAQRQEYTVNGVRLVGYLRLPVGVATPPCVVLLGGLESTKEESYHFENLLLRRGMATFAFDGPGQGECFPAHPFVPDWERYSSGVLDELERQSVVDPQRFAILGRSLGGYLAVRSASQDERFGACVAFGALFDLRFFRDMAPVTQQGFRHITGIEDPAAAEEAITSWIDLSDVIDRLTSPLYVLHGAKDPLIPVEQAHLLESSARHAPVSMHIEPDGDHCAHNLFHRVRPEMADWLALHFRTHR